MTGDEYQVQNVESLEDKDRIEAEQAEIEAEEAMIEAEQAKLEAKLAALRLKKANTQRKFDVGDLD